MPGGAHGFESGGEVIALDVRFCPFVGECFDEDELVVLLRLLDHSNHRLPGSDRVASVKVRTASGNFSTLSGFTSYFTTMKIMLTSLHLELALSVPANHIRRISHTRSAMRTRNPLSGSKGGAPRWPA